MQRDLAATLRKLVEAERQALKAGKSRKEAIYAAYDRFYKGDIAQELVRGVQEEGGLITLGDLANWKVKIEEPLSTDYKGITVYKLPFWQQGPAMLQALNILENVDLKAMGYNSPAYIHTLYQAMNLAFADRDFYYGDPAFPPDEPVKGLLSKDYAKARLRARSTGTRNDPTVKPGDPYPFQGGTNPFADLLARWTSAGARHAAAERRPTSARSSMRHRLRVRRAVLRRHHLDRGRRRGGLGRVGHAERRLGAGGDRGAHRRRTEPAGAELRDPAGGRTLQRDRAGQAAPGDAHADAGAQGRRARTSPSRCRAATSQDQNLLQFFLDIVEFGMTPQQAVEAPNINSYQMRSSFGDARVAAGADAGRADHARQRARRAARRWATPSRLRAADLGADQRDPLRPRSTGRCGARRAITARTTGLPW